MLIGGQLLAAGAVAAAARPALGRRRVAGAASQRVVGVDDVADQPVPDDVVRWSAGRSDVLDAVEDLLRRPAGRCCVPPGRSTWVTSPVTTILEPKPSRVRNIFICSGVVFCASSRMMNASLSVRPRM